LNSIHFIDKNTGWIVGDGGKIFKTGDGGWNWIQQPVNTNLDLNSVYFANEYLGWAVGQEGIILKTIDGGANWQIQQLKTSGRFRGDNDLYGVCFVQQYNGWIVGRDGLILSSVDGGTNWTVKNSGTSNNLYGIHFNQSCLGWAVGSFGTILKYDINADINHDILTTKIAETEKIVSLSNSYELRQNYPNPFNPSTTIQYDLSKNAHVVLKIYNSLGQEVRTLVNGTQGKSVTSGVFVYRLEVNNQISSKRMILLR
jgi:hypothetical protein